jgi:hemolysin activation/secretion protein
MRAMVALPASLAGALEVAAGTSGGRLAPQHLWSLGGPQTLRGYAGGTSRGEEFWRARIEAGTHRPAARLALFADAGRTAARGTLSLRDPLMSAGVGVSLLDGLARIDLARALRPPTGWRLDFYVDALI